MSNDPNWYAPPAANFPSLEMSADDPYAQPISYAGFNVRAGARFIDFIAAMAFGAVGGAMGGALTAVLAAAGLVRVGWLHRIQGASLGSFAFGALASLVYHACSEGIGGASVGKAMLGLRVKNEDLRPCGVVSGVVRNLAYYIDAFFFGLVAHSVMSGSPTRQRLGDKWGHTVVVMKSSLPASAQDGVAFGLAIGIVGQIVVLTVSVLIRAL